jgi:acyl-CoA thioesterase FadM
MNTFDLLTNDIDKGKVYSGEEVHAERRWSYGDVENNGVYYHPQLTHYAHQAFEEFFYRRVGLHYVDLSRRDEKSQAARSAHSPSIPLMTFPVEWLHQWMHRPMHAGETFRITIDTVDIDANRIGVRAWVYNEQDKIVAVVIWLRAAVELEPKRRTVSIPSWFPRE